MRYNSWLIRDLVLNFSFMFRKKASVCTHHSTRKLFQLFPFLVEEALEVSGNNQGSLNTPCLLLWRSSNRRTFIYDTIVVVEIPFM